MKFIFSLLVTAMLFVGQAYAQAPDAPHILVNGYYEESIVPDLLQMSLDISKVDQKVATARSLVEQDSAQLIEALNSLGVAKADINSSELNITPHYNWNNRSQVYVGTEVSRTIKIVLRDLSKYDMLVRSIIDANVARINNTELKSSKEKELQAIALQGAVQNARQKAQLLVADFPETIGSLHSITATSSPAGLRQSRYRVAEFAGQKSFEPGVIKISESVEVIFYLDK